LYFRYILKPNFALNFTYRNSLTTFAQIAQNVAGSVLQAPHAQNKVLYLATDSRKLVLPEYAIFFAIKGERHDGHQFLQTLYAAGVRNFVVEQQVSNTNLAAMPEANILLASNAILALQTVAKAHRETFQLPILAITGSNGKTIVKEWTAQLLSRNYKVVRSPRSYNSQIGVPLSVWNIAAQHTFGVFEAGISKPHEMAHLQNVIQPTIGIFTTIGTAHDEGFASQEEKISEKWKLFKDCPVVIYCRTHEPLHNFIQANAKPQQQLIAWQSAKTGAKNYEITHLSNGEKLQIALPFDDAASVENVLHCVALLHYLKIQAADIQERVLALRPVSMRLELKEGINNCYLIDDSYNNDLAGLTLALDFLNQQNQAVKTRKTVVLSDVPEAGAEPAILYKHVAKLLEEKNVSRLIAIGHEIVHIKPFFSGEISFFESTEHFLSSVNPQDFFANELVLIKGARAFHFERVSRILQEKVHGTRLEINLDALVNNLNYYRSKLKPNTKMMLMVKAFAYGSGSYEVANLLQFHRVDYLAVAYTDEGVALRQNGITLPIMVMNPSPETFDKLLAFNLEPEIYSFRLLQSFVQHLPENQAATIHLKIDTGMRRLGFEESEMQELTQRLSKFPQLKIASVFTHLAGSDEAQHNGFSQQQIATFTRCAAQIEQQLGYNVLKHALNSPGIIRFPEAQFDMVRLGIGLYGLEVNGLEQHHLQTVGTLKTTISQIKKVPQGETIGYGRHGIATQEMTLATIAIGYADGFNRAFSRGVGKVKVNGKLAPVVGNVCMDMCMIDITGISAQEGDEVIIFDDTLTISDLAKSIHTIPYEILTNVSERVKRVFYTE
jgi:alanine racemase